MTRSKKINIYEQPASVSRIIRKPETSKDELQKLADRLGINVNIVWRKDYDPRLEKNPHIGQIINIGSPMIGGTHWCATYMDKYFDSLSMPPAPNMVHLQWTPLEIQNFNYGHCGQYALFFIYYAMRDELDQFYSSFNPRFV